MSNLVLMQSLFLDKGENMGFRRYVGDYEIDISFNRETGRWDYYVIYTVTDYYRLRGSVNSREKALRKCNRWLVNKL